MENDINVQIQNIAKNIFAVSNWIDSPEDVKEATDYRMLDKFTEKLSLSQVIKKLRAAYFEEYLYIMARDCFSLGYIAIHQQYDSTVSYDKLADYVIDYILDEIWECGAFEFAIGPMGEDAKSGTKDICLLCQTFISRTIGNEKLKDDSVLKAYNRVFFNIGIAMGYKIVGPHLY